MYFREPLHKLTGGQTDDDQDQVSHGGSLGWRMPLVSNAFD